MTEEAEVAPGRAELKLIRRLMRIMALYALPLFHRGMDDFLSVLLLVALITKLADIGLGYSLKLVFADRLVTGCTLALCHRNVNEL